jgi:hypothetical protein
MKKYVADVEKKISESKLTIIDAVKEVAIENNINNTESLRKAYTRAQKITTKKHGNQLFSEADEKKILWLILAFSSSGVSLARHLFLSFLANYGGCGKNWAGNSWFGGFVQRNKKFVTYSSAKGLDIQLVNNVTKDVVHGFITSFKLLHEMYNFDPDFIINAD